MALKGHRRGVTSIGFTEDNYCLTGSLDGSVRLWDLEVNFKISEEPKLLYEVKTGAKQVDLVCMGPAGSNLLAYATTADDGTDITVARADTGAPLEVWKHAHKG